MDKRYIQLTIHITIKQQRISQYIENNINNEDGKFD